MLEALASAAAPSISHAPRPDVRRATVVVEAPDSVWGALDAIRAAEGHTWNDLLVAALAESGGAR